MARIMTLLFGAICILCITQITQAVTTKSAKVSKTIGKDELFVRYLDYFAKKINEAERNLKEMKALLRTGRDMMTKCHSVSTIMRSSKSPEEAVEKLKDLSFIGFDNVARGNECNNPDDCFPFAGFFFG
ncbi:hypothetical protein TrispH2_000223 [Trichoplax sp. H2]|nr:hypothetical protein TrispH2_000223 [Trichoplax sp. H2]|eukprot:RDD47176.1 hypothetical protein TrispH2_000223 [Trichoplax sp. H2]